MDQTKSPVAVIGGSAVAIVVSLVVIFVVSYVVAILFGGFQYYIGNVRWEAAIFLGNVAGAIVGVNAARYSCDALIKQYSPKSVAVVVIIIGLLGTLLQFGNEFSKDTVFKLATSIPLIGAAWFVFWNEDLSIG